MNATLHRTLLLGTLLATTATGCEVTRVDCDETPEADICQPDPEEDASDDEELDGAVSDGGTTGDSGRDGSVGDARSETSDAGSDAGSDGGTDGSSNTMLTVPDFCVAQLATAVAWRDGLEDLCGGTSLTEREAFLGAVFGLVDDAEGKCITALQKLVDSANTTYDATKAQVCVDTYLTAYDAPPSPFYAGGIDLAMVSANVGHGAPVFVQLPECRATFTGKLARDKVCTDSLECIDGLRCLPAPGNTTTCQPALTIGTCTRTSNCADGHTCVGSNAGGGKTCVKSDALPSNGGNCALSLECAEGLICNAAGKCANPAPQVICKP